MCELFALSASSPVLVRYDLDRFAAEGGERHQNRDGWGIVFSEGLDAHYFREAAPAANSPLDRFVRAHAEPHSITVAHVRRASAGTKSLANTHPFRRAVHGRLHHFAHNGTLHGIEQTPEAQPLIRDRVGETDSELAFLLLLDRLARLAPEAADHAARFKVFRDFCADMARLGSANFLWLDGDVLFVHADRRRHETAHGLSEPMAPGLHIMRPKPGTMGGIHECSGAVLQNPPDHIVVFASVALSDGPWEPLPQGNVLAVHEGKVLFHEQTITDRGGASSRPKESAPPVQQ